MHIMVKIVIFTDLDGTLLDRHYRFRKALPALELVKKEHIPLVICSSKTRAEIEVYQKRLRLKEPFISENGGGIFIPKNYFGFDYDYDYVVGKYKVLRLGTTYKELKRFFDELKKHFFVIGFHEMAVKELAYDSGLSLRQAALAKKREFDLPFKILKSEHVRKVFAFIKRYGFNYTKGGSYYHLIGNNNKGGAVKLLTKLFKKQYGSIRTIALGDSKNDFEMLDNVDKPYLVMKQGHWYASKKYLKAHGIGPEGWHYAVMKELKAVKNG